MYYKTPAEVAAVADCSTTAACGPAQTTGSMEYPIDAAACTSGVQIAVDMNAADGTYNWKCDTISCSAIVLPHCEITYTILWVTDFDFLTV